MPARKLTEEEKHRVVVALFEKATTLRQMASGLSDREESDRLREHGAGYSTLSRMFSPQATVIVDTHPGSLEIA